MINPSALRSFLSRTLTDSRTAKRFTDADLDEKLARLDPPPKFVMPPARHQKVGFLLCAKYPTYALWFSMGLRKTASSLTVVHWRITRGDFRRALVLVPYGTQVPEWAEREAKKHRPDMRVVGVTGSPEERRSLFWDWDGDIVVCTYAGFLALVCDRVGGGMVPNQERVRAAAERFGCLILDESTQVQNWQSVTFKTIKMMRAFGVQYLYELTGTPFGKDPHGLWSQFYLLDQGATLGATLGIFRAAFFTTKRNFWGGFEHTFKKKMEPVLHSFVANRSIRYESEEVEDLPPMIGGIVSGGDLLIRRFDLPDSTRSFYDGVVHELREARGNFLETENVWHRMRRLSSGYALPKDDAGEEHPLVFPSNPKLDALLELLTEVPLGRQVLVFCIYQFTGKLLLAALRKAGYRVGRLYGGQATKEQNKNLADFIDGKTHIMVASETVCFGLNLQNASFVMIFESPTSPIVRRQLEKRCHRGDQKHRVFIYDLVARGTVDEKILRALEAGQDVFESIVNGRVSLEHAEA